MAFELPKGTGEVSLAADTLSVDGIQYDFLGRPVGADVLPLKQVKAYQEFWHSWRSFHPATLRYETK